ncbi:MAG: hypothetical protein EZS28_048553 [Streblomastix strix]|uniref:Uncharacterized protein n=1 Tax=Streblomastix strix TaxID=222440 RepID=A0A5J4TCS0_9EUKA|nr:MAG: hypothetical protein EZS28_048553 [Streblomastix strix]
MATVLMALRVFRPLFQSQEINSITLETDNQTVKYSLRRWRAKPPTIYLYRQTFQLLREMQITLFTIHIPGLLNLKADSLSRLAWREDYKIKTENFNAITMFINFIPEIDLFDTKTMKMCRRYCSLQLDKSTDGKREVFNISWVTLLLLIHTLIQNSTQALNKLRREPSTALFILPDWCMDKFNLLFPKILLH